MGRQEVPQVKQPRSRGSGTCPTTTIIFSRGGKRKRRGAKGRRVGGLRREWTKKQPSRRRRRAKLPRRFVFYNIKVKHRRRIEGTRGARSKRGDKPRVGFIRARRKAFDGREKVSLHSTRESRKRARFGGGARQIPSRGFFFSTGLAFAHKRSLLSALKLDQLHQFMCLSSTRWNLVNYLSDVHHGGAPLSRSRSRRRRW